MPDAAGRPVVVFVVNTDWFFLSHRLAVARKVRDSGAHVVVVAPDTGSGDAIAAEGFRFVRLPISRSSLNPLRDLHTLVFLIRVYRRLRPALAHHVTIKPVIYGSLAARWVGGVAIVNAVSGLGWVFGPSHMARVLRPVVKQLYRAALGAGSSHVIFQNPENRDDFIRLGLVPEERTTLIRGSGVDCREFQPTPEPRGVPVILFAGRMLWDKGVGQFVAAARLVNAAAPRARFVLVGVPDTGNPRFIPCERLESWARDGVVEWWGKRTDMPAVLAAAHVIVLPTFYPEGVPKILLEGAASGRSLVATDVPGCREIVRNGVNGFLVPPGDVAQLANAIGRLIDDRGLRASFGAAGRGIAVSEFAQELVVGQTLAVYRRLLGDRWPPVSAEESSAETGRA